MPRKAKSVGEEPVTPVINSEASDEQDRDEVVQVKFSTEINVPWRLIEPHLQQFTNQIDKLANAQSRLPQAIEDRMTQVPVPSANGVADHGS